MKFDMPLTDMQNSMESFKRCEKHRHKLQILRDFLPERDARDDFLQLISNLAAQYDDWGKLSLKEVHDHPIHLILDEYKGDISLMMEYSQSVIAMRVWKLVTSH